MLFFIVLPAFFAHGPHVPPGGPFAEELPESRRFPRFFRGMVQVPDYVE
jgi:hypothetical protein